VSARRAKVFGRQDGNAKIGDFGLAVALDRSRLTMEGMMVGTVAYMPPEQALGRQPDARSDLYSLGCVTHEMVTGARRSWRRPGVDHLAAHQYCAGRALLAPLLPAGGGLGLGAVLDRDVAKPLSQLLPPLAFFGTLKEAGFFIEADHTLSRLAIRGAQP